MKIIVNKLLTNATKKFTNCSQFASNGTRAEVCVPTDKTGGRDFRKRLLVAHKNGVLSYPSRIGTQEVKRSAAREWVGHIQAKPRSVHPHFQGSCVVFALLISIPRGSLTDTCVSHLLWLCYSAESGLITSVGQDFVLSSYIYIIPQKWWVVKRFLKSF